MQDERAERGGAGDLGGAFLGSHSLEAVGKPIKCHDNRTQPIDLFFWIADFFRDFLPGGLNTHATDAVCARACIVALAGRWCVRVRAHVCACMREALCRGDAYSGTVLLVMKGLQGLAGLHEVAGRVRGRHTIAGRVQGAHRSTATLST